MKKYINLIPAVMAVFALLCITVYSVLIAESIRASPSQQGYPAPGYPLFVVCDKKSHLPAIAGGDGPARPASPAPIAPTETYAPGMTYCLTPTPSVTPLPGTRTPPPLTPSASPPSYPYPYPTWEWEPTEAPTWTPQPEATEAN